MKILTLIPPFIPSYFNAGHHLGIFQVAAYIRHHFPENKVTAIDAAALNFTWKEMVDLFIQKFDVIVLMNDFDGIDTFSRTIDYIRIFTPQSKLITFGRLSFQIPDFFKRYSLHAIVYSGDYEAVVGDYIQYLTIHGDKSLSGLILLKNGAYHKFPLGRYLQPEDWVLPDINDIPYEAYDHLYANDLNKFCGIPERRELVVPVARGCPIGCHYCEVPIWEGIRDRRLPIKKVIQYINQAFSCQPFEYISFYAPTFTLNKKWVIQLCEELINVKSHFPWKCVTTLSHLDEELIRLMAQSGCVRISVGLETLDPNAFKSLPQCKKDSEKQFVWIAKLCGNYQVELNCFVMFGLPGDSPQGVEYTVKRVLEMKARVRPTIYTPYHRLRPEMTEEEVRTYNRQTFVKGIVNQCDVEKYYQLFYNNHLDRPTEVMNQIHKRWCIS